MEKLILRKCGDPVLRRKSEEIKEITKETRELAERMKKTMLENNGAGLAAPQIGISKRIIIVQTEKGPEVFVNPKIIKKSTETTIDEEGCLSVPGVYLKIRRAKEILVEAQDLEGRILQVEAKNLAARVFQHEVDHINGVLIIDKLNFFQKLKIRNKLKGFS